MKKWVRFITACLLIAALLAGFALPCFADDEEPPEIDAKAAILMDADSGNVLYSLNEDTPLFTAGLSVMMTALLAAEAAEREEDPPGKTGRKCSPSDPGARPRPYRPR